MSERRTIAALASAPGRAAIAIVRISGARAGEVARSLGAGPLAPRRAELRTLKDPQSGEQLDRALVLWFPAPASYTGEDVVEFHLHGGRAVVDSVLGALGALGVSVAEPGEFTRRAFENGKLDLTEVEALADLIAAETREQQCQASRQLYGQLRIQVEGWRATLIRAAALIEAAIDFPDEDLPTDVAARAAPLLRTVRDEIAGHLSDAHRGERLREGLSVALVGPVNAGKSTLLNTLARRDVAIVSEHAGTTRDVLEVFLDLGGFPVTLIDMAGLRDSADPIEREGVRRARARAARADLRLLAIEIEDRANWAQLGIDPSTEDILVRTKSDRGAASPAPGWPGEVIAVSALTGQGLDRLIAAIGARARAMMTAEATPLITRARHRAELSRTKRALEAALSAPADSPELIAEEVRTANHALGRLAGRVDVEDVLDVIFAEFCLGK
jgi:tRNA modification GTPase